MNTETQSVENEYSQPRYRKVLDIKNNQIIGWFATRLNYTENTFEVACSKLHRYDTQDSGLGKHIALMRLTRPEKADMSALSLTVGYIFAITNSDAIESIVGLNDTGATAFWNGILSHMTIRDLNAYAFDSVLEGLVAGIFGRGATIKGSPIHRQ